MNILITGICGFVGSELAMKLRTDWPGCVITGIDNLSRSGSERNVAKLTALDMRVVHGDVRVWSDFESLGPADWVIDAAANPSVLAGVDGKTSSRQLIEHNLWGTINVLEYCKQHRAGLTLLSTSRVYGIEALNAIALSAKNNAFVYDTNKPSPAGSSPQGIDETFSTAAPTSLYGATKLSSEIMALEYAHTHGLRVLINRCGVLAGAGQFGTAEQGIFSYWIRAYASGKPLRYIGFDGTGKQVRDALHPRDLAELIIKQIQDTSATTGIWNVAGGADNAMSLAQLSAWCAAKFPQRDVSSDTKPRLFDVPWVILDSRKVQSRFAWKPRTSLQQMLDEIAVHHMSNPNWPHGNPHP